MSSTTRETLPTDDAPRWPLHAVVWVLLPFAIVGAGALSGSATLLLLERHDVPEAVRPAGLGMVEVLSLAGTLLTIFSVTARLRRRAMVAVVAAGVVAMVGGWQAYGWVGLLAGLFLVGLVHLASEAWLELRDRTATPAATPEPVAATAETSTNALETADEDEVDDELEEPFSEGGGQDEDPGGQGEDEPKTEALPVEVLLARAYLADHPEAGRRPLAAHLTEQLGRPVTTHEAGNVKAVALASPKLEVVGAVGA